jgi:hypothetical protein
MSRQLEFRTLTLMPERLLCGGRAAYRQPTTLLDLLKTTRVLADMVVRLAERREEQ